MQRPPRPEMTPTQKLEYGLMYGSQVDGLLRGQPPDEVYTGKPNLNRNRNRNRNPLPAASTRCSSAKFVPSVPPMCSSEQARSSRRRAPSKAP